MSLNNEFKWANIYKNDFADNFQSFNNKVLNVRRNYKNYSSSELIEFSQNYLKFFEKTIELFKYYFNNNKLLLLQETRLIVIYILKCNILQNGILLYEIYLEMKKIKDSKLIVSKKILTAKYFNIFVQINKFFEQQQKMEDNNAFFD